MLRSIRTAGPWLAALLLAAALCPAARSQDSDTFTVRAADGEVEVRMLKHGSVLVTYKEKHYYIDPAQLPAEGAYPKADAILVTHEHGDHCDPKALQMLRKEGTVVIGNARSVEKLGTGQVMKNGDTRQVLDAGVEAVPAYNIQRPQYHPKGRDNGYVLTLGGRRLYFAGDTEVIPEMKDLKRIDVAFLPINLPYTMSPAEAVEAVRAIRPRMVVPYHQGQSNPKDVADALVGTDIVVKVIRLP